MDDRENVRRKIRLVPRTKPALDPVLLDRTPLTLTLEEVVITSDDSTAKYVAQVLVRSAHFRAWFCIIQSDMPDRELIARPQEIRRPSDVWATNFTCSMALYQAVCAEFVNWQADQALSESRSAGSGAAVAR